jgi:hypothetical protein
LHLIVIYKMLTFVRVAYSLFCLPVEIWKDWNDQSKFSTTLYLSFEYLYAE